MQQLLDDRLNTFYLLGGFRCWMVKSIETVYSFIYLITMYVLIYFYSSRAAFAVLSKNVFASVKKRLPDKMKQTKLIEIFDL